MGTSLDPDALALLRTLGRHTKTRAELTESTGWSRNTVATRLDALVKKHWVIDADDAKGARGRPSTRYQLNPSAALVFVASFGWDQVTTAICTLQGDILVFHVSEHDLGTGLDLAVDMAQDLLEQLSKDPAVAGSRIAVAVVGVPSPVANPTRLPTWRHSVASTFSDRLGIPALIENDVNLMALGTREWDFPFARSLVYIKVATGIGAGIVLSGHLHRGLQGLAGEIGHVPIPRASDIPCACGNTGCLATIAANQQIIDQLNRDGRPVSSLDDVQDLVTAGDPEAVGALRQAGRDIAQALTGIVTGLAPELLVFGGRMTTIGDHLITGVRESLYRHTLPSLSTHLRIERTPNQQHAAIRGATVLAFEQLFQS